jgi:DNA-binding response OmpR family regulator
MKKTILLVDDDQRLRNLLQDYLSEKNFDVYSCEDFNESKEIVSLNISKKHPILQ